VAKKRGKTWAMSLPLTWEKKKKWEEEVLIALCLVSLHKGMPYVQGRKNKAAQKRLKRRSREHEDRDFEITIKRLRIRVQGKGERLGIGRVQKKKEVNVSQDKTKSG